MCDKITQVQHWEIKPFKNEVQMKMYLSFWKLEAIFGSHSPLDIGDVLKLTSPNDINLWWVPAQHGQATVSVPTMVRRCFRGSCIDCIAQMKGQNHCVVYYNAFNSEAVKID